MPDMVPFGMKSPRKENRQPKLTVISAVMRAAYSRVAGTILPVATVSPLLSIRRWIEPLINCVPIRLCRSHDVLPRLAQSRFLCKVRELPDCVGAPHNPMPRVVSSPHDRDLLQIEW
jgi:hypothetical protein